MEIDFIQTVNAHAGILRKVYRLYGKDEQDRYQALTEFRSDFIVSNQLSGSFCLVSEQDRIIHGSLPPRIV